MYSTCLFCNGPLGQNEMVEQFPVGRRLAFDAAKGRLWVVCRQCERWNLTPLEERWEAIEECERLYRDTRLRVSTGNIGLCRLRDRTELVRVGDPLRPEMAAWRYGDQFGRRRRRHIAMSAGGVAVVTGLVVAGPVMGLFGAGALQLLNLGHGALQQRIVARVPTPGGIVRLNHALLIRVRLSPDRRHTAGWTLEVPTPSPIPRRILGAFEHVWDGERFQPDIIVLSGDEAFRAARAILPRINAGGGNRATVEQAVDLLDRTPEAASIFGAMAPAERRRTWVQPLNIPHEYSLAYLPLASRLALEMALHESDERRALEGELSALEDRWREAEEIAGIADDMFVPAPIRAALQEMRERD